MLSLAVNLLVLSIIPMISTAIFHPLNDHTINGIPTAMSSNLQSGLKTPDFSTIPDYFRIQSEKNKGKSLDLTIKISKQQKQKQVNQLKSQQPSQQQLFSSAQFQKSINNQKEKEGKILKQPCEPIKIDYYDFLVSFNCRSISKLDPPIFEFRRTTFQTNLETINKHNSNPHRTYNMGLNCFSDQTFLQVRDNAVLSQQYSREKQIVASQISSKTKRNLQENKENKKKIIENGGKQISKKIQNPLAEVNELILKQIFYQVQTSRNQKYQVIKSLIGSVQDQGRCNSCYAFSVLQSIEISAKIRFRDRIMPPLSTQQMISCGRANYAIFGCSGGNTYSSFRYVLENQIGLDSYYEYNLITKFNGFQAECNQEIMNNSQYKSRRFSIKDYKILENDCDGLLKALKFSAVSSSIRINKNFLFYKDGIYYEDNIPSYGDHAITILGFNEWDNTYFIKNSWGSTWGISGFGLISEDAGLCQYAAYPTFTS